MKKQVSVGIAGFGKMGEACGTAFAGAGYKVYAYDVDPARTVSERENVRFTGGLRELIAASDILIVAVKPQHIAGVLGEIRAGCIQKKPLVISIAAGVSLGTFQKVLAHLHIVRAMPNLAAQVRASVTFLAKGPTATVRDVRVAAGLFSCLGEVIIVPESYIDKATSVTGSGPGYLFYIMDALMQGARALGFDNERARTMVEQTVRGALLLAQNSSKDFATLARDVASKRGTTEAALAVFKKNRLQKTIVNGVKAAYARAQEISREINRSLE